MVIIGFLLIIVAVAAAVILIVQNTGTVGVQFLGQDWDVKAFWLVVAGIVALAVAVLGLTMVRQAGARANRRRQVVVPSAREPRTVESDERRTDETTEPHATASTEPTRTDGPSEAHR